MTTGFIQDYIPSRMRELGFMENYRVEWRTLVVPSGTTISFTSYNIWLYVPVERLFGDFTIESDIGWLATTGTTGQGSFEHTGQIEINNSSAQQISLSFIAAIPE